MKDQGRNDNKVINLDIYSKLASQYKQKKQVFPKNMNINLNELQQRIKQNNEKNKDFINLFNSQNNQSGRVGQNNNFSSSMNYNINNNMMKSMNNNSNVVSGSAGMSSYKQIMKKNINEPGLYQNSSRVRNDKQIDSNSNNINLKNNNIFYNNFININLNNEKQQNEKQQILNIGNQTKKLIESIIGKQNNKNIDNSKEDIKGGKNSKGGHYRNQSDQIYMNKFNNNYSNNLQKNNNNEQDDHQNNNQIKQNIQEEQYETGKIQHQRTNSSTNVNIKQNVDLQSFINQQFQQKFKTSQQQEQVQVVSKKNFDVQYVVGKGGFGKVWIVEFKKNKKLYAMKDMNKAKIISKKSIGSVMNERQLLYNIKSNFIVNMIFSFQDRDNLYLIMDLMKGGDLRYHIGRMRRFSEEQTKFFIVCVLKGLFYLHRKKIIHRDIKPENLVLDEKGYLRITDLGIAREYRVENSSDTSGTPGYMAPEVMCRQNHSYQVDYYAVGVMGYEFMLGRYIVQRPYLGMSRKEIRDAILSKQVYIRKHEIPIGWSVEAADFINKMIIRKPFQRLGANGIDEILQHPWLQDYKWDKLEARAIKAPFIPNMNQDNFDQKQLDERETNEDIIEQNQYLLRKTSVQNLFQNYTYNYELGDKNKNLVHTQQWYKSIDYNNL